MHLTDIAVKTLPIPTKGQKTHFDDTLSGFGIRVSQGGSKSFIVMYGTARQLKTLGKYPDKTLKSAREEAKRFLATVTPDMSSVSTTDALRAFLSHCEVKNRPRTVKDYSDLLGNHLPTGRVRDMTRKSLMTYFRTLQHTPSAQAHAITAISVFLNWCVTNGWIDFNPIAGLKRLSPSRPRMRSLTGDELVKVLNHAMSKQTQYHQIVALCVTTGLRRGEVARLEWKQITANTITIPSEIAKNNNELIIPIGDLTRTILDTIPVTDDMLFGGRNGTGFSGWSKSKKRFDKDIEIEHYTIHDLRRTFASTHAQIGTPIHVVEKLLNHVSGSFGGVAGIYNRYSYQDEMKEACAQYEDHIRSLGLG